MSGKTRSMTEADINPYLTRSEKKPSACNGRTAAIVILALAALTVLVVGILGMQDIIGIGEIGSKVMIGLSAGVLGGLLINTIRNCYLERKAAPQYEPIS